MGILGETVFNKNLSSDWQMALAADVRFERYRIPKKPPKCYEDLSQAYSKRA